MTCRQASSSMACSRAVWRRRHAARDVVAIASRSSPSLPVLGDRPDRPDMSGADLFGLIVSALVCVYLVYALLRGEKL